MREITKILKKDKYTEMMKEDESVKDILMDMLGMIEGGDIKEDYHDDNNLARYTIETLADILGMLHKKVSGHIEIMKSLMQPIPEQE